MLVNRYVKSLKPYPLVSHKAWEIDNKDILKLDWNEATIPPSPLVKKNIINFLENGHLNWYPDVNNTLLIKKLSEYNKLPEDNIQYFASSDSLHEYIIKAYLEAKDKVLIVSPTYDNFRAVAESSGAIIKYFNLDKNFKLDLDKLYDTLKCFDPKIIYICNPNNPTGTIFNLKDLKYLISNFENNLFLIDEAYYEFTGISCKDLVLDYDNLIISRTFSKAFALASFRIGYAISSVKNIKVLTKIRNPKNITSLSQIAAISALDDIEYMQNYVRSVNTAKDYLKKELNKMGIITYGEGGNFVLLKLEKNIKKDLINFLEQNLIFVRDYSHIKEMEEYIRITIGTKNQMEKVINKIKEFFDEKGFSSV